MPASINQNLMARNVARNLNEHYGRLSTSVQRLSSGLRINSAADDASGLAIRELMRSDVSALHQGARNANDAISMIQVAAGALGIIDEKLVRMKELAEQAATGTYNSTQRLMIDSEFQQMASEIDRIARATSFNGIKLLDGSRAGAHNGSGLDSTGSLKIHFGPGNDCAEDYYYVSIGDCTTSGLGLGGSININQVDYGASKPPAGSTPPTGTKPWEVYYAEVTAAAKAVMGNDVDIISSTYTGHKQSLGIFTNGAGAGLGKGMDNGLILGTGDLADATSAPTSLASTDMNSQGDPLLDSPGNPTQDAASLEIAFRTNAGKIYFNYVFATEEWPQYFNSNYNDVCGIFLKKETDSFDKSKNVSRLDNVISINGVEVKGDANLNGEISLNNVFKHSDLFVDNAKGANSFAANGYTHTFRIGVNLDAEPELDSNGDPLFDADGNPVYKEQIYTLRFSVADRSDGYLDSWILVNGLSADQIYVPPTPAAGGASIASGNYKVLDIKTQEKAQYALTRVDRAIETKDKVRAHLGAMQNRLENTISNLSIQADNLQGAESRISDIDVATEMTEFVRNQILTQSSAAMLAQANNYPQMLINLVSG